MGLCMFVQVMDLRSWCWHTKMSRQGQQTRLGWRQTSTITCYPRWAKRNNSRQRNQADPSVASFLESVQDRQGKAAVRTKRTPRHHGQLHRVAIFSVYACWKEVACGCGGRSKGGEHFSNALKETDKWAIPPVSPHSRQHHASSAPPLMALGLGLAHRATKFPRTSDPDCPVSFPTAHTWERLTKGDKSKRLIAWWT